MHRRISEVKLAAFIAALFFSALSFRAFAQVTSQEESDALQSASPTSSAPVEEVPYVQTPHAVVRRMLQLADVQRGETLWDLGSGDGRIVIEAARRGAKATGFEIDPRLVAESKAHARRAKLSARAQFVTQDIFTLDFRAADIVTLYLLPEYNLALRPRLLSQLKPGARIVSHEWDMGDWLPDETLSHWSAAKPHGTQKDHRVYLWLVPAQVAGRWRFTVRDGAAATSAAREIEALIEQSFQRVKVNVTEGRVVWAELRGRALSFHYENGAFRATLRGTVSNDLNRVVGTQIVGNREPN